ncbi:MAG: hypothetical protein ACJAVA_002660 [Flavobacteriaceae bacterium]|jgi:hypothetical protein
MIISHDLKLIFIHVHRTGGTAFSNILKQELKQNFEVLPQHNNIKTMEPTFLEKYANYYTFGFARNPWERILSWYSLTHFNHQKRIEEERLRFENFVKTDTVSDFTTPFFHYNSLDYFTDPNGE